MHFVQLDYLQRYIAASLAGSRAGVECSHLCSHWWFVLTLFSRIATAVSAVILCKMSLGDVVDSAILTFKELRGLARRHSIDDLDSMARVEVVGKLLEAGVGVFISCWSR